MLFCMPACFMTDTSTIQLVHPLARMQVRAGEHVLAVSDQVIRLEEQGYPPRLYFPRGDIAETFLVVSDKTTHCPYKGDTQYFHIRTDAGQLDNAAWCYLEPIASMQQIAGHLAFDHGDITVDIAADHG